MPSSLTSNEQLPSRCSMAASPIDASSASNGADVKRSTDGFSKLQASRGAPGMHESLRFPSSRECPLRSTLSARLLHSRSMTSYTRGRM
jgi:hypothetical protein